MKKLIRKILKESRNAKFLVEPGSHIYIRKVNEQLIECDPLAYSVLRGLEGSTCQVVYIDDDVNLIEIGTAFDGELWCEDYFGWGMLITSDKITSGHNGHGNSRCGDNNCYWVNEYYIDFELIDSSFDTEDAFNKLYE